MANSTRGPGVTYSRLQKQIKKKHDLAEHYKRLWQEDSATLMQINCVLQQVTGKNWFEMVRDGTVRQLINKHIQGVQQNV